MRSGSFCCPGDVVAPSARVIRHLGGRVAQLLDDHCDSSKSQVLRSFRNLESVGFCRRGKVFHALVARKEKERSPVLVYLMHGTVARELGRAEGT